MSYLIAKSRDTFILPFILLLVIVCGLKLAYVGIWISDNDNYATLGTFFRFSDHPDYQKVAQEFYKISLETCERIAERKRCIAYAGAIHGEQAYARPLTAFFGSFLSQPRWLEGESALIGGVTRATSALIVSSTGLVILLLFCFSRQLPRPVGVAVLGITALFGVGAFRLEEHSAYWYFQPLLGGGFGSAAAVLLLALGAWLYSRTATTQPFWKPWLSEESNRIFWVAAMMILIVRIAAAKFPTFYSGAQLFGSGAGLVCLLLLVVGIPVFVGAITVAAMREKASGHVIWISIFLLFGFVSTGGSFFTTAFHITAKGYVYLLAGPIMLYVALRPNGRAIWLLPLIALFHVTVAGLLFGCIVAVEIVACLRRRTVSLALVLCALFLVGTAIHTALTSGNAVGVGPGLSLLAVLGQISMLSLLPSAAIFVILLCAGYAAWRLPDPVGDLLLRAVVLGGMLAGAAQMSETLQSAGYDLVDPAVFHFVLLWKYLAPIVCSGGTFLVMLAVAASGKESSAAEFGISTKSLSLVTAGVLALMAVRSETNIGRPNNLFVGIAAGLRLLATQHPASLDSRVVEAATPDDHYIIGPFPGDAVTMLSLLKMKARSAAGLLDNDQVTITALNR